MNSKTSIFSVFVILFVLATANLSEAFATVAVTPTADANTLANALAGPGVTIVGSPILTGGTTAGSECSGTFTDGTSAGIGILSGIILTSGFASNAAVTPNTNDSIFGVTGGGPDADLSALVGGGLTFDKCVLEFDITTTTGDLFFNYVFASDEYNEFANTGFNDVFGLFVDGTNVALVPPPAVPGTPVSVNNVNGGNPFGSGAVNPLFFNNNDPSDGSPSFTLQYDGFTDVFTATALGLGSGNHHIKLAIADKNDAIFDSAVFIQEGSFTGTPPPSDIFFDSPTGKYPLPSTAIITVNDDFAADSGSVSVSLDSSLESILVSLTETTPGVFVSGEISFVNPSTGAPNVLGVSTDGDIVTATYSPDEDVAFSATVTILPTDIVPSGFPGAPPGTAADLIRFYESNVYFVTQGATIKVNDPSVPPGTNSIPVVVNSCTTSSTVLSSPCPTTFGTISLTALRDGGPGSGLTTFTTSPLLTFASQPSSVNPSSTILAVPNTLPVDIKSTRGSTTTTATVIVNPTNSPVNPATYFPDTSIRETCSSSIAANGPDTDGDGICDKWEIAFGQPDQGLKIPTTQTGEFYKLGCTTNNPSADLSGRNVCPVVGIKDLYVQIDWMQNQKPGQTAINNVVNAFKTSPVKNAGGTIVGVRMHPFLDNEIPRYPLLPFAVGDPSFQSLKLAYFGSNQERTQCDTSLQTCRDLITRMLTAKRQVFRYAMFGISQADDPFSSGYAERPGNDLLITLDAFSGHVGTQSQQERTLFHELGHTLSLKHGGTDTINGKPNYPSVMNYLYQFILGEGGIVSIPLDYSRSIYTTINEQNMIDGLAINPSSASNGGTTTRNLAIGGIGLSPIITTTGTPIDWNRVSGSQSGYLFNVHNFASVGGLNDVNTYGPVAGTSNVGLTSQIDWNNLLFNSRSQDTWDNGVGSSDGFESPGPFTSGDVTLTPSKDSYLRRLLPNTNEGANKALFVTFLGTDRTLVAFDQEQIRFAIAENAAQGKTLQSATLNLYINFNLKDWGTGRDIEVRPLTKDWSEGNGYNEKIIIPIPGTGRGVTWNCADDSNINNFKTDCSTASKWNGGSFGAGTPTSKVKITNGKMGWISFDVKNDVNAFYSGQANNGWIIKKSDEGKLGLITFASRESSSNGPELVLTFATPP